MYFPYLKAKGEEANALVGTLCSGNNYNNVIPIIEPRDLEEEDFYSGFIKIVDKLIEQQKKFICLVENEGDLKFLKDAYGERVFDEYCIYGFINFFPQSHTFKNGAVIHTEATNTIDDVKINYHIFMPSILQSDIFYTQNYPLEKAVYISDAFYKYPRNSDYPAMDAFNNSQLCYRYQRIGIAGFGDYTIMEGNFSSAGGGNQNTITHIVHLTSEETNNLGNPIIATNHFLTTPIEEPTISLRSMKTLEKTYNGSRNLFQSEGVNKLIEVYNNNRATSLGMYKRIGIMHHISLMNNIVNR